MSLHLLVLAKAPVAGRVKTRLTPPFTPEEAAQLAEAALVDTLTAVAGCRATRRILALEGEPGPWLPRGFDVVAQAAGDLNDRLAGAWAHAAGPGLQIGSDTPQVTSALLDACLGRLGADGVDAVLGPALDGGWWAIGFAATAPAGVFAGIPISTPATGAAQRARLQDEGLRVADLPALRDVDVVADAVAVAEAAPDSRFARTLADLEGRVRGRAAG